MTFQAEQKKRRLSLPSPVIGIQANRANEGKTYRGDDFLVQAKKLPIRTFFWFKNIIRRSLDFPNTQLESELTSDIIPRGSMTHFMESNEWGDNATQEALLTLSDLHLLSECDYLISTRSSFLSRLALRVFWAKDWANIEKWKAIDQDPWGNWPWHFGYIF